jgi:hypothetical protein
MHPATVTFSELNYISEQSRAARGAQACFKTAIFLRAIQPALSLFGAALLSCSRPSFR